MATMPKEHQKSLSDTKLGDIGMLVEKKLHTNKYKNWNDNCVAMKRYEHINFDPVGITIILLGSYQDTQLGSCLCTLHFDWNNADSSHRSARSLPASPLRSHRN